SYYGLAENAFGSNPGGNGGAAGIAGSCPAANPLSEAECAGTDSQTRIAPTLAYAALTA
ncbi:Putative LOC100568673, partial [Caligus rogercresseyi]